MTASNPLATAGLALAAGLLAASAAGQPRVHEIRVESPAMASGETMPRRYTPDGHNVSPPIIWSGLPEGTREIAVVCADFGAGSPPPWVHWIVYGIPAHRRRAARGTADPRGDPDAHGSRRGDPGAERVAAALLPGPAPPAGTPHLYHFTVYALDEALGLEPA